MVIYILLFWIGLQLNAPAWYWIAYTIGALCLLLIKLAKNV